MMSDLSDYIKLQKVKDCATKEMVVELCHMLSVEFCDNEPLDVALQQCINSVKCIKSNLDQIVRAIK
jgi:dissimilatory sulfite reductase (desulfoviridin) alpha/beta subunit